MTDGFVKKIGDFIDKQNICFFSTLDELGYPNIECISSIRKRNKLEYFYICTPGFYNIAKESFNYEKSCVYFCDEKNMRCVMFRGESEIINDIDIKKELWLDSDSIYFPGGYEDKEYYIIKFKILDARLLNNFRLEIIDIRNKE